MRAVTGLEGDIDRIEQALGVIVRQTRSSRFSEAVRERAGIHLDRATYMVLVAISRLAPARLSDIATDLAVDVSTISRQVAALEQKGLIDRQGDPDDRRASRISLSAAGEHLTEKLRAAWRSTVADALDSWSERDLARLAPLIERFAADVVAHGT